MCCLSDPHHNPITVLWRGNQATGRFSDLPVTACLLWGIAKTDFDLRSSVFFFLGWTQSTFQYYYIYILTLNLLLNRAFDLIELPRSLSPLSGFQPIAHLKTCGVLSHSGSWYSPQTLSRQTKKALSGSLAPKTQTRPGQQKQWGGRNWAPWWSCSPAYALPSTHWPH